MKQVLLSTLVCVVPLLLAPAAFATDTDGDGLLDLIDVPGFNPNAWDARYIGLSIEDLDGARLHTTSGYLSLVENEITSIDKGDFKGLTNLHGLTISPNPLTRIEEGSFDGLHEVDYLDLSDNQLSDIESGWFSGMVNSEQSINLRRNQFTTIQRGDFESLSPVHRLELQENQITSIDSGALDGVSVGSLFLSQNHITSIDRGDFDGLAVWYLDISNNQIENIERGAFDNLEFYNLSLSGNQFTSIESGAFQGLTNLIELDLSNNPFTELNLAGATFHNLQTWEEGEDEVAEGLVSGRDNTEECCGRGGHPGFLVDSGPIFRLILDDASLSPGSLNAIVSQTHSISEVSLVDLTFSGEYPASLDNLLGIATLDNVTVDLSLFQLYANEFNAFDSMAGNTVTVVPEPASIVLLMAGLFAIVRQRRPPRSV